MTGKGALETYVSVSDERYFPGTLAMLNSLRLTGHRGKVVIVDSGLTNEQRATLEPHVQLITLRPGDRAAHPLMKKALVRHHGVEGVLVFVDSDIVVTGNLAEPLAAVRVGKVFAFPDHQSAQSRFFPEWQSIFALKRPLRRQTYVNAGFFTFSTDHHPQLLQRWQEAGSAIDPSAVFDGDHRQPTWAGDQDALNALLMSEVPAEQVAIGGHDREIYWDAITKARVDDATSLRVSYGDGPALLLHHAMTPKVWERRAWRRVREDDAYLKLLPRLLYADDLTIRLAPNGYAPWIRPGRRGKAALLAVGGTNTIAGLIRRRDTATVRRKFSQLIRRGFPALALT